MTFAMYMIAWLELNNMTQASQLWPRSYANAHEPYLIWTETPTQGAVNFITGIGGFLQGVISGWGGLRLNDNSMDFNPILPPSVNSMKLNSIQYLGNRFSIQYNRTTVSIRVLLMGFPLSIYTSSGAKYHLVNEISFARTSFSIAI